MSRRGGDGDFSTLVVRKRLTLHTPLKADVIGKFVGELAGNVHGSVTGSIKGDVDAKVAKIKELHCGSIIDRGDGHGIKMEQVLFQKGTIHTKMLNVDGFFQADILLEHSDNHGIKVDGVHCKDSCLSAQNVTAQGSLIAKNIKSLGDGGVSIEGVKFSNSVIEGVEMLSNKGGSGGYCELDANAKIPLNRLNSFPFTLRGIWNAATNSPSLNSQNGISEGDCFMVTEDGKAALGRISEWKQGDLAVFVQNQWNKVCIPSLVSSVNGKVGSIQLNFNDFRITSLPGDLLIDNGNEVVPLEKGDDGQVMMVNSKQFPEFGIGWTNLSLGFCADLPKMIPLYNNIPTTLTDWIIDKQCGGFNDGDHFKIETGLFHVPSNGKYRIDCSISFETQKFRQTTKLDIIKNNTMILAQDVVTTTQTKGCSIHFLRIHTVRMLEEGDVLGVVTLQTNEGGENVLMAGKTFKNTLSIVKIA